jgi:biotin synthase-like enzyme
MDGYTITAVFNKGARYHEVNDLKQAQEDARKNKGKGTLTVCVYTGNMTFMQVSDVKSADARTFNNRKNLDNFVAKGYG